jgi:hypothetical protein
MFITTQQVKTMVKFNLKIATNKLIKIFPDSI